MEDPNLKAHLDPGEPSQSIWSHFLLQAAGGASCQDGRGCGRGLGAAVGGVAAQVVPDDLVDWKQNRDTVKPSGSTKTKDSFSHKH